jgi:hypothetical protein
MTPANKKPMIGLLFGKLLVLSEGRITPPYKRMWHCRCFCGNLVEVRGEALRSGNTTSCGCTRRDKTIARSTKHGHAKRGAKCRTYKSWQKMIGRCLRKTDPSFADYGGRGIKVCKRWRHSFENFLKDMGESPSNGTIERNDNNGHYEPKNCRWATIQEQNKNRRSTRFIEHNGEKLCIKDWARKLGINYGTLLQRVNAGWCIQDAFSP